MSVLYLIKSADQQGLLTALQRTAQNDAVLLIEDAALLCNPGHVAESILLESADQLNLFVLQDDLLVRGVTPSAALAAQIQQIDYDEFVRLTIEYPLLCQWGAQ